MNILHVDNEHNYKIINESTFLSLLDSLLDVLKYEYIVELSVIIIDSDQIKLLNNEHRFVNKSTDVLSFPINMNKKIIEKNGFNLLGDIYMCDSIIRKNCFKTGRTIEAEYSYMFLHSVLHLMGYDHVKKEKEKQMDEYVLIALNMKK